MHRRVLPLASRRTLALATLVLAPALALACSTNDDPAPLPSSGGTGANGVDVPNQGIDEELADLGVTDDEFVMEDELDETFDVSQLYDGTEETEFEDFPDLDADEIPTDDTGALVTQTSAPADNVWYNRCLKGPKLDCQCRGSLHNCRFPNKQPGGNRYLSAATVKKLSDFKKSHKTARSPSTGKQTLVSSDDRKAYNKIIEGDGVWPLAGETELFDGNHVKRGTISASTKVKINFGQRRQFSGQTYVYVTQMPFRDQEGRLRKSGSGWILDDPNEKLSGFAESARPEIDKMPTVDITAAKSLDTRQLSFFKRKDYTKCGASIDDLAVWGAKGVDTCRPDNCLPSEWALKVANVKAYPTTARMCVGDYTLRYDAINLMFQLPRGGGANADTFLVEPALSFQRAKSKDSAHATILKLRLYKTKNEPSGCINFVFGEVAGRQGWVAAASLKGKTGLTSRSCK
ncbi:MAG: hypothetical protein HOO96_39975 [Polyangiaceae bacterium]|nr:hypothetical protein [Polyangiaceae bacterium]